MGMTAILIMCPKVKVNPRSSVDLKSPMRHAKFQSSRTLVLEKFFTIYGHGGHIGHVTKIIFINICPLFPRRLHIKFGFDWQSDFREEYV